jgi:hypothetical protein
MIEFTDYANVLARSLNQAIKEPHTHLAVFIMNRDGNARLDFIQNLEYKFVELLSVSFLQSPEAAIREHISFRYQTVRAKLALTQARLNEVTNIVSTGNCNYIIIWNECDSCIFYDKTIQLKCFSATFQGFGLFFF